MTSDVSHAAVRRAPFHPVGGVGWGFIQAGFAMTMTMGHLIDYTRPWGPWLALLAVPLSGAIAGISLSARWARTRVSRVVSLLWLPLIWLVGSQLQPPLPELSALWPAIAALIAMGLVAMTGAPWFAWGVAILIVIECVIWADTRGLPPGTLLEHIAVLTPMIGGSVYRIVMRRARDREVAARDEEAAAIQRLGMLASQAEARREYRTRVLGQVGDLLDEIALGEPLTDAERAECRLVEAGLRDAIRGRGLATRDVAYAARAARERGATVTLIDDRGAECKDLVCRNVIGATRETLDRAIDGDTCVARLLPMGRRNVATVLLVNADGSGIRREFTLPPSGNPDDGAFERPPVELTA